MNKVRVAAGFLAAVFGAGACLAAEPSVTNVRAAQRAGSAYVDITYDLADADTATLSVTVAVSTNGGAVYFTPASGLSGHLGSVARGAGRKIVWNAGAALPPKLFSNVRARVTASDSPAPSGMVAIPAGTNSGTDPDFGAYSLTVSAFFMDATEVTKAQWDEVYAWAVANGYGFSNAGSGKASGHPVHTVNWHDCVKWCNARSQKEGRTPAYYTTSAKSTVYKTGMINIENDCVNWGSGYRMPTDNEWEYAARGGASSRRFPWGDRIDHTRANYYAGGYPYDDGYSGYDTRYATGGTPYTSPGGTFAPNGYGLYDMAGNVWEWCWDWYPGYTGSYRVARGGGWSRYARYCRAAIRSYGDPSDSSYDLGFRSVLPPGQ